MDKVFQTYPGLTVVTCQRCREDICPELEKRAGIAFAIWECPECGARASQFLEKIDPEQATIEDEGEEVE